MNLINGPAQLRVRIVIFFRVVAAGLVLPDLLGRQTAGFSRIECLTP